MNLLIPLLALTLGIAPEGIAPEGEPISSVVHLPDDGSVAALRALRQTTVKDLLLIGPSGVVVHTQNEPGVFAAEPMGGFNWPSAHLAWDVVDLAGDGLFELLILHGDGRVTAHGVDAQGAFGDSRLLLESQSYLPRGVSRMRFARDVDGDGRADLVLPAAGLFRVHVQDDAGAFGEPLVIEYEAEVSHDVGSPTRLDAEFGQSLSIPFFTLEDVDGDGVQDLVSKTAERVDFHLARPEISSTPTWSLDLVDLAESLPEQDGVNLDDLMANLDQGVKWSLEDLDHVAPRDLVLQLGATIRVHLGGSVHGTSKQPDQVLKISGNLLHYFLRRPTGLPEKSGDQLPDLQLLRGERISLGRVLRWLILPGSLDFEFFTYKNTAGTFTRKPTRRNTLTLEIPRLLTLMDEVEDIETRVEAQFSVPAQRADFDGDGQATDVVDFEDGELRYFHGAAPLEEFRFSGLEDGDLTELLERLVLEDLDQLDDGDTKTIDLGEVVNWNFSPGFALREATKDKTPTLTFKPGLEKEEPTDRLLEKLGLLGEAVTLRVLDLDGDARDDVVLWSTLEDSSTLLQFLVQPKR